MKGAGKIPPTKTLSPSTKESLLQASRRQRAYRVAGTTSGNVVSCSTAPNGTALDVVDPATARPDGVQNRSGAILPGPSDRSTDCYSTPLSQLALARLPG